MHIKKFVGSNLKDATAEMVRDLGPDAIVIGTRRFTKGGIFNFLAKEYIEITAAVDRQLGRSGTIRYSDDQSAGSFHSTLRNAHEGTDWNDNNDLSSNVENLKRVAEQFSKRKQPADVYKSVQEYTPTVRSSTNYDLALEVDTIKATLGEITQHIKYSKMPALPDSLSRVYEKLIEQDVDDKLAADIVQGVYGRLSEDQYSDKKLAAQHILNEITGMIEGIEPKKRSSRRKSKIIALVGPTGVGKTTTIAKLASIKKLVHQEEVGLISVDTYRIGAIEQLRTFAAIADLQMEVVYKPSEMQSALRKLRGKSLIFIDTVGRSQRMKKELNDLRKFVEAANPDETHLVLNTSTNIRTMHDIVTRFKSMDPNRLIFTKLDEAVSFGPLLSIVYKHRIPISYATMGQDVPDDILSVDPAKFAKMVYTGVIPNA